MAVRMADIAKRMGVSIVTISKALGDKDGVSDEIRSKIKIVAAEMGYRNNRKSNRKKGSTGNIGVLIPASFLDNNNTFYWELYKRVVSELMKNNHYGILEVLKDKDVDGCVLPQILQDKKADGLILIGQVDKRYLALLKQLNIPIMLLDSYDAANENDSVISDGYYGMYLMINYLISMGHSKIFFVGTVNATSSISDRYFGYCRAMSENNIPVTPNMLVPDRVPGGTIDVDLPEDLPTAFACNCDLTADCMVRKLQVQNIRVPEDISIIGFDNYTQTTPAITTYAVDIDAMAKVCVETLMQKLQNKEYFSKLQVVCGQMIIKESVKRLK